MAIRSSRMMIVVEYETRVIPGSSRSGVCKGMKGGYTRVSF